MGNGKAEKYGLDPRFERAVAALACSRRTFYRRIGHAVIPEQLEQPAAVLLMQAAHAIKADTGQGPESSVVVLQRLRRWMQEGRVTLEQVRAACDLFDEADDFGLPDEDAVAKELTPVLRHQFEKEAVKAAVQTYGAKDGDWSKVQALMNRASTVGIVEEAPGVDLGLQAFGTIKEMRARDRLPTGIMELDAFLDGGAQRAGLSTVMADAGGGKSMFLSGVTAHGIWMGQNAAYVTTELPEGEILSRIIANLTSLPIHAIQNGSMEEAKARLMQMHAGLGLCVVKYFEPTITTVEQVVAWTREIEQRTGKPITLLVVDYGDRLTVADAGPRDTDYKVQGKVFERLRVHAQRNKLFAWTASQVTRGEARRKRIDLNDVADSKGKVRYSDLVISANVSEQQEEVSFYVAKHLTGRSRATVGPMPTEFALGRIAPVFRESPPF